MSKLTKMVSLLLATFLAIGVLAGCTGGNGGNDSDSGQSTEATDSNGSDSNDSEDNTTDSQSASTGQSGEKITINIGQTSDIISFHPHEQSDMGSATAIRHIYSRLLHITPEGELIPSMAESWEIIDDQTIQFNLRDDIYFHNGEPFVADDVKFSLERQKVSSHQSTHMAVMDEIEVVDDHTCIAHLNEPAIAVFLTALPHHGTSIMNKKTVEALEAEGKLVTENPIGTGAYKFVSFQAYDRTILEKNEDYWGTEPANDELVIKIIPDGSARTIALETGEIDLLVNVEPVDADKVRENSNLELLEYDSTWMEFVILNNSKPPFDNKLVREAVSHLVARESIIRVAESGEATPLYSPIGAGANGYSPDVTHYEYDVERAKELLAEAGYPDGFDTTIYVFGDNRSRTAQVLQASFEEAGINLTIEMMERAAFYEATGDGMHEMALSGWIAGYEPDMTFSPLFLSTSSGLTGNRWMVRNTDLDEIIFEGKREPDNARRMEIYADIQRFIIDEAMMIPLYTLNGAIGIKNNLVGCEVHSTGQHYYDQLRFE